MSEDDVPLRAGKPHAAADRGAAVALLVFVAGFGGMVYAIGAAIDLF